MSNDTKRPLLPQELFIYNATYRVLICSQCGYAIQPNGIPHHLKHKHNLHRSCRRPYVQHAARFDLADAEQIIQTRVTKFPVPSLPVIDGFKCTAPEPCDYLCASAKRMQSHWVAEHKRPGSSLQGDWKPVPLQTFFRGNMLSYFTESQASPTRCTEGLALSTQPRSWLTSSRGNLDELDSMLFHHYLTSTYLTLADRHGSESTWQITIPQIAEQNPFLVSALLSVSALHVAHKFPSQQAVYHHRAHLHQDVAMPMFRNAIENVDDANCHAFMAFAHLLVINSMAADQFDEPMLLVGDISSPELGFMCSWLYFLRNGCLLVCEYWEKIENGPLKSLAECWEEGTEDFDDDVLAHKMGITTYLLSLVPEDSSPASITEGAHRWTEEVRRVYEDSASRLGSAFAAAQVLDDSRFTTWDALRVWPMELSPEYIDLLVKGHPAALILLAHYCLLLERLQSCWYRQVSLLLKKVMHRLNTTWHPYIQHMYEQEDSLLWVSKWI